MKKRLNNIRYNRNNLSQNNCNSDEVRNVLRLPKLRIPYVKGFYEKNNKMLSKFNILTIPKIPSNLNNLIIKGKDKIPHSQQTNVVYKLNCNNCSVSYVGQCKVELRSRMYGHKNDMNKEPEEQSVVSKHRNIGHEFNWDKIKILDKEPNYDKRLISEMIHISACKHSINKKTDTQNLHTPYISLLHKIQES